MITVGTMRLPQPEPLDDLEAFLRGLEPDGGYWATMRRLADHDHSGGLMGVPVAGGGGGSAEVTITGTEGVTVVESPANTFALGLTASPDANNTIEIRANGIYAAAGAIPPEYVTDAELATALGPYALDTDLANHAAAADPHPAYLTAAEGNALYRPISYVTDVTITPDASLTATETPANTFALAARLSPDAGNALALRANGLYSTDTTGAGGAFVDEAGDTMTGTLTFQGAGVDSGGAVRVLPPGVPVAAGQLFGAGSPAFGTTTTQTLPRSGIAFTPTAGALTVMELRWYRVASGNTTPTAVELWDTVTQTMAWSYTGLAAFADTAVGWKSAPVPPASRPAALVSGRAYHLVWSGGSSNHTRQVGYTPVPDGSVTVGTGVTSGSPTGYPSGTASTYYFLDAVLGGGTTVEVAAQSGAIRLANAANGMVAWRNAANTADLPLTVNASNALTFNGLVVVTQAALDALTTRVATLETSVTALKTHVHELGTFGAGTLAPTGGIP